MEFILRKEPNYTKFPQFLVFKKMTKIVRKKTTAPRQIQKLGPYAIWGSGTVANNPPSVATTITDRDQTLKSRLESSSCHKK